MFTHFCQRVFLGLMQIRWVFSGWGAGGRSRSGGGLICPLLCMYKHQKAFCFRQPDPHDQGPLDPTGGSASRTPLEARPVVHPTFLDPTTLLSRATHDQVFLTKYFVKYVWPVGLPPPAKGPDGWLPSERCLTFSLQCSDAIGWATGRRSGL